MRLLGLDYGSKTVGVAVTDPLGYTAQPLETITRKEENKLRRTLARIEQLVGEYQIEKIVLGYPVNMDGSAGERAELALAFKAMLERRTKLEVIMQDERLTTVAADEILQECGMPREKRKTVIDQVAAGLILQDFMENTNKGSKLADSESDTEEKNNNKNGRNNGGGIRVIKWKEDEGTDMGLKQPGTLYFPYVEKLGLLLLRFLNADLYTYETAYKDFFYAYGFEILKDVDKDYKFTLKGKYGDDNTYLKETKKIYDMLKEQLIYIQEQITDAVNYIYNINENEQLKPFTHSQRYAVYLIKRKGKLYSYIKNDEVIPDNYSNKYDELGNSADIDLLKKLKEEGMLISMVNTHKSNDISSICYDILEELSKTDSYPIKKCQNCGMYFIPNSRLDEIYCDYPKENGKTCREQGAILSYNKRLQEKSAYTEYRKTYQQKFGIVNKNKDDKKLKAEFETWKKQAKEKIIKLKHGELTEDEVYEWLQENK